MITPEGEKWWNWHQYRMVGEYKGRAPNSVSEDQKGHPRGSDVLTKILGINQLLVRAEGLRVV